MSETRWESKFKGSLIWQGMLADIEAASESIEMEQFSFFDDLIGTKFLEAFERKLGQGVKIRLMCDALNSQPLLSSPYLERLRKQGLKFSAFNPLQFNTLNKVFFRNHRKILILDSKIAWVGGIGIKDKFADWRDTQVRVEGPVVAEICLSFESVWDNTPYIQRVNPESEFHFLANHGRFQKKEIYEWMRDAISRARERIYIATSYFYPDRNFFQLILDKTRQGVDVKIILRGSDDEFFPVRFSASYFQMALNNGVNLYRYLPTIMHSKTVIIDDAVTVGSCNMDKFSFYYNLEANIVGTNPEFVRVMTHQFMEDLKACRHLSKKEWADRPIKERLIETLIWPIHNYL